MTLEDEKVRTRYYFWTENGPMRVAKDFCERKKCYPQFAGRRMRYAEVVYWMTGDQPTHYRAMGAFCNLDNEGRWDTDDRSLIDGMNMVGVSEAKERTLKSEVPRLDLIRRADKLKKDFDAKHRWQLSRTDLDLIANDLLGVERIPIIKKAS